MTDSALSDLDPDFVDAEGGVGVGDVEGKVAIFWQLPSNMIAFYPADAKVVAEKMIQLANRMMN